jgi:p-aminobenzoyl-glutamate transporter AbgT
MSGGFAVFVLVVVGWFVLMRFVLPKLGIST